MDDQAQNEQYLDDMVDTALATGSSNGGSLPLAETPADETVPVDTEAVAPVSEDAATDSDTVEPDPTSERLARIEQELAIASEKARTLDYLNQAAQQQVWQQQEAQRQQAFVDRIANLENLPAEAQQLESQRIAAEIEYAQRARYEPQVQQAQASVEETAAIATGIFHALQAWPEGKPLTAADKQAIIKDAQYLSKLPSPQAQQETLTRDKAIADNAVKAARAEWERMNGQAVAARANDRITQGTDLVGVTPGSAVGGDDGSMDWFVDQALNQRR